MSVRRANQSACLRVFALVAFGVLAAGSHASARCGNHAQPAPRHFASILATQLGSVGIVPSNSELPLPLDVPPQKCQGLSCSGEPVPPLNAPLVPTWPSDQTLPNKRIWVLIVLSVEPVETGRDFFYPSSAQVRPERPPRT
jgi:hypothetical protein